MWKEGKVQEKSLIFQIQGSKSQTEMTSDQIWQSKLKRENINQSKLGKSSSI